MDKEQIIASLASIELWREIAAGIVAIALGAEVILGFRYAARNKELGVLQKKEEQQLTLQIEGLRSNNLVLQKQLFDLKLAQEPRIFTPEERETFIAFLKDKPKGPVRMGILFGFSDKMRAYADQIRNLLRDAGFQPGKIEVLNEFIPTLPPNTSIGVYIWKPEDRPPYTDFLAQAFANVADKVSGQSLVARTVGSIPFQTNDVMVFIANYR